jgi:hypothetical protein
MDAECPAVKRHLSTLYMQAHDLKTNEYVLHVRGTWKAFWITFICVFGANKTTHILSSVMVRVQSSSAQ